MKAFDSISLSCSPTVVKCFNISSAPNKPDFSVSNTWNAGMMSWSVTDVGILKTALTYSGNFNWSVSKSTFDLSLT